MKILVINGANLNMLGMREPDIYGNATYDQLVEDLSVWAKELGIFCNVVQSNCEGEIVTLIQNAVGQYDALVINPGAYTHYSYAILDALLAAKLPAIEVHISNIQKREDFRKLSVTAAACIGQISGLGTHGYKLALQHLAETGQGII